MQTNIDSVLLLGQDYGDYGAVKTVAVTSATAASISVGSDLESPSLAFKGSYLTKNEDALCVVETDTSTAFVLADAHFGCESSHVLVSEMYRRLLEGVPRTSVDLDRLVRSMGEAASPISPSETTLGVLIYDRSSRNGFGMSVGDSTFMAVEQGGRTRCLSRPNSRYVSTATIESCRWFEPFDFDVFGGELLLGFTDGVNECHYRHPETSIQDSHIAQLASDVAYEQFDLVDGLSRMALAGIGSNPGGQDNIAIVATSTSG